MSRGAKRAAEAQRRLQVVEQRYEYQFNKRGNWDCYTGLPSAAAAGDRKSLRKCAAQAALALCRTEWESRLEGLRSWLIYALREIEVGREPNDAFSWSRKRPGAPDAFEKLQRDYLILQALEARVAKDPTTPFKTLRGQVAEAYGVSDETVRKVWKEAGELANEWEGKKLRIPAR